MRPVAFTILLLLKVATGIDLQISPDASQKMVRREILQPGTKASSLAQARQKSKSTPATPNFDNGSFEKVTMTTDALGVQYYTYTLASPVTSEPEHWTQSGTVVMVPSNNADYGSLPAPAGGVVCALRDANSQIEQTISDHTVGQHYMLSFEAADMPNAAVDGELEIHLTGAHVVAGDTLGHADGGGADTDPDWKEPLLKWFATYDFVYEATAADVTVTVKNASPAGSSTVMVDAFDIAECSGAHECDTPPEASGDSR